MKIAIVGTGYVGLVTGTCFAEMGNDVICVDVDTSKLALLERGDIPIHEPGLDELVKRNVDSGRLSFSPSLKMAMDQASVVFIAVGTPPKEDGSADLSHVLGVANEIGTLLTSPIVVVDKSTVPVGTADQVKETISGALLKRAVHIPFSVVSNPEFLKEGAAVQDFLSPDRIVVGAEDPKGKALMAELYAPFSRNKDKIHYMGVRDAEMTKYAANAMLATKISFMNEIALMCESYDVDVEQVRKGMGSDSRIGFSFIYPGVGYGGSCFPKDVRALSAMAEIKGIDPFIMSAVERRNNQQKERMLQKLEAHFGDSLSGKKIALWGLAFKPETDDVREAPALVLTRQLLNLGVSVNAYDPEAMKTFADALPSNQVQYFEDKYDVLDGVDALVVMTEWKEFRQPDFDRMKRAMQVPHIFDGRNIFDPTLLIDKGFGYEGIGRK